MEWRRGFIGDLLSVIGVLFTWLMVCKSGMGPLISAGDSVRAIKKAQVHSSGFVHLCC